MLTEIVLHEVHFHPWSDNLPVAATDYWWPNEGWKTQSLSFFVLGLLTFLPGSYVSYVSYCAYRGYPGYRFSHIPVHED